MMTPGSRARTCIVALAFLVCATGTPAAQDAGFTERELEVIDERIRSYILANPEIVLQSLRELQARMELERRHEEAERVELRRGLVRDLVAEIEQDPDDPVLGNAEGDVTLVEFFDYQCGFCKRVTGPLFETARADGRVRLVMKEFPILGPVSVVAARAALAARRQGRYEDMHIALMNLRGRLTEQAVLQTARELGLDVDRLEADMADPEVARVFGKVRALADRLGIGGTPAFIIGGEVIEGAVDAGQLQALIREARAPG
ncbi:MAG: DsbA family protein [Alphaproteobacteria bacterium]|nr:DsbA family protein [Alphaproteobacteria bacterium]